MSYNFNYGLPPELAREYEEFAREQLLQQQQQQQHHQTHVADTAGEVAYARRASPAAELEEQRPPSVTTTKRKRSSSKKSADSSQDADRLQSELAESKRKEQELLDDLTEKELELESVKKAFDIKSKDFDQKLATHFCYELMIACVKISGPRNSRAKRVRRGEVLLV